MDFSQFIVSQMGDREDQKRQARILRESTNAQLADAVKQSKRYEQVAAIAPMAGNPAFEKSAQVLAKQGAEEAPTVTNQQIYYGGEGRLEENPIYTEAKGAEREGRLQQMVGQQLAAGERAQEANALRMTMAQMSDATRRSGQDLAWAIAQLTHGDKGAKEAERKEKADAKAAEADEKAVQEFQKRYTAANLPNLVGMTDRLNTKLKDYYDKGKSVPGIGYGSSQVQGIPLVSDLVLGEEGKSNRSMVEALSNSILTADAGKQVTLSEEERFALATMKSGRYSEKDFESAWKNIIIPRVNEIKGGIVAGFKPEVINTYAGRYPGYDPSTTFTAAQRVDKPKASSKTKSYVAGEGKPTPSGLSSAEEAELADLKKRLGK